MHAINKNLKHAVMVVPIQGVDEFVFEVNKELCLKKHMEILAWKLRFRSSGPRKTHGKIRA